MILVPLWGALRVGEWLYRTDKLTVRHGDATKISVRRGDTVDS
jgi:hypothetical protein